MFILTHNYGEVMPDQEFWIAEGMKHIVPQGMGEFPEGFDVIGAIKDFSKKVDYQKVIDFGCGYGRLCESFKADQYLGVDINPQAIREAKERFPKYSFEVLDDDLERADLFFAYTVFLHIGDRALHKLLKKVRSKYLLVGEILGREWRRIGNPPVYNRNFEDYIKIFRTHDFVLKKRMEKPYERYSDTPWHQDKNTNFSFILFERCKNCYR